jgi:hypothetical protein
VHEKQHAHPAPTGENFLGVEQVEDTHGTRYYAVLPGYGEDRDCSLAYQMPPVTTAKSAAYIHDRCRLQLGHPPINNVQLTLEEKGQLLEEFIASVVDGKVCAAQGIVDRQHEA